jgi:nitrite reductase/ring-hydroxylating ferredoxin subunit
MARHRVADAAELEADGSRVIAEVDGVEVAVFRIEGEFHAVANFCVHQGGPLCEGELRGRTTVADNGWEWEYDETEKHVVCPWHGWLFDVTTGVSPDDETYAVPTYDVEVEDGGVFVHR